jgi:hypothetical protein
MLESAVIGILVGLAAIAVRRALVRRSPEVEREIALRRRLRASSSVPSSPSTAR